MTSLLCRLLASISVTALLVGCSSGPVAYTSSYTDTPPVESPDVRPSITEIPEASFVDYFDRPDTTLGLGNGWEIRGHSLDGRYPFPPASDGFIRDGSFTYSGDSVVYAVHRFQGTVRHMGAYGSWARIRPHGAETTMVMTFTSNDRLMSDVLQFSATRDHWSLTARRANGKFKYLAREVFDPPLVFDHKYRFEVSVGDHFAAIWVPGEVSSKRVAAAGLVGDRAMWEEWVDPRELPAGSAFRFDTVWATVDGETQSPLSLSQPE